MSEKEIHIETAEGAMTTFVVHPDREERFPVALLFHRLLLGRVFDDDELMLVGIVAVLLVVRQHRKLNAVGLALLDDDFHELFVALGL